MKGFLLVLLGISIWQLVVFATIQITGQDEEKVNFIGMGYTGWLIYGMAFIYAKIRLIYRRKKRGSK